MSLNVMLLRGCGCYVLDGSALFRSSRIPSYLILKAFTYPNLVVDKTSFGKECGQLQWQVFGSKGILLSLVKGK